MEMMEEKLSKQLILVVIEDKEEKPNKSS